jgi:hypothetical protein
VRSHALAARVSPPATSRPLPSTTSGVQFCHGEARRAQPERNAFAAFARMRRPAR